MKAVPLLRPALLILCATFALGAVPAHAQWQWVDKNGRKVFSDSPPPSDIPQASILKRPAGGPAAAAAAAAPATPGPAAPQVPTKDPALEAKKKAAEQAELEKQKAQQAEQAKAKAENCARARRHLGTLESGVRLRQLNAKGEAEFMSDEQRAAESRRAREVIASDCGAG